MTWFTTWPDEQRHPAYAAHDSEAAAEVHAHELVASGRARVATVFELDDEEMSA